MSDHFIRPDNDPDPEPTTIEILKLADEYQRAVDTSILGHERARNHALVAEALRAYAQIGEHAKDDVSASVSSDSLQKLIAENATLKAQLTTATKTISIMENNAGIQAKLLADTARKLEKEQPPQMTESEKLLELASRVEKMRWPDQELDREIAKAFDWSGVSGIIPALTAADFEAVALVLVPNGAGVTVNRYYHGVHGEVWSCLIVTGGVPSNPYQEFVSEDACSAAMAICAAALRLKAARVKSEE